ncbi:hypothetical protein Tco_1001158 [Tanacetum coccineum]
MISMMLRLVFPPWLGVTHIKIDNLTQDHLVGPVFNLLKGTCRSRVELEYNIVECNFLRLHLYDTEDMLLLLVQKKLSNLERDVIFDLGMALRMFTRRIIILKRVEDLQLGVEIYQKKLNITNPETFRSDISNRIPYTAYNNPQGIIYEDKYKSSVTDELYKFSDETLISC